MGKKDSECLVIREKMIKFADDSSCEVLNQNNLFTTNETSAILCSDFIFIQSFGTTAIDRNGDEL